MSWFTLQLLTWWIYYERMTRLEEPIHLQWRIIPQKETLMSTVDKTVLKTEDSELEFHYSAASDGDIAGMLQRLTEEKGSKKDYIVHSGNLNMRYGPVDSVGDPGPNRLKMTSPDGDAALFSMMNRAHQQLATKLGITAPYYRRMQAEAPGLLAVNVNHWLTNGDEAQVMLRTMRGSVRAILSNRYRVMDNADIAFNTIDIIQNAGAKVVKMDITPDKMFIRALVPDWAERIAFQQKAVRTVGGGLFDGGSDQGRIHYSPLDAHSQVVTGNSAVNDAIRNLGYKEDWMIPGITISNSETGQGRFKIEQSLFRVYCLNTAVFGESLTKTHLGSIQEIEGLLSEATRAAGDAHLWGTVRDLTRATFNREQFHDLVAKFGTATKERLDNPVKAVETIINHYSLPTSLQEKVLNSIMGAGEDKTLSPTTFGLVNAITEIGRDEPNPERAIEFERLGGELLDTTRELVAVTMN